MICASLNLLFFTSVSFDDGLSLKPRDQEGGRSSPQNSGFRSHMAPYAAETVKVFERDLHRPARGPGRYRVAVTVEADQAGGAARQSG